jgi:hypothetical protein
MKQVEGSHEVLLEISRIGVTGVFSMAHGSASEIRWSCEHRMMQSLRGFALWL